jgi:hypothetical protein
VGVGVLSYYGQAGIMSISSEQTLIGDYYLANEVSFLQYAKRIIYQFLFLLFLIID